MSTLLPPAFSKGEAAPWVKSVPDCAGRKPAGTAGHVPGLCLPHRNSAVWPMQAGARLSGYRKVPNLSSPRQERGRGGCTLALSGQLLLTFLSAALLGQVLFALVKWKLSREAETLFTFRFDRL